MEEKSVPAIARRMRAIELPATDGTSIRLDAVRDASQIRLGARFLMDLDPAVLDPVVEGRWLEGYDVEDVLSRVQCPVLLLAGDQSCGAMLTLEDAAACGRLISDCTRVDFQGAGHLLHWQRTDEVLRHVAAFLESLR